MRDLLTPRQVARAFQVSESSVKRWCDKGVIPTQYTAGGHRRITRAAVMEFLRAGKYQLVRPEALGLPATSGRTDRVLDRARQQLTEALLDGDEQQCRQIVVDLYLAEHSLGVICDAVFAASFRDIGQRWSCGEAQIYQERRGCEITHRILHEVRSLLSTPPSDGPRAIGGTTAGDSYSLGTTMAELVLRDAGWQAGSMGSNLPTATLGAAIREQQPKLFWLSCSYIADESEFLDHYNNLHEEFGMQVAFVVGGNALTDPLRKQMKYSAYCDNMQHLESFAQTLHSALQPE